MTGLWNILDISIDNRHPYLVIISFSSSLSNYYDAGGRVLPLFYNINTLMYRPCPNCLSFLQAFPSAADSTFCDRQLFFDSQLKACFDEVDRTQLQLALQQCAKENHSSPGDI